MPKNKTEKGYTLIELLIVVAVIGILAAVSIPAYVGQQRRAAQTEAFKNLEALRLLEEQFFAENASYTAAAGDTAAVQALLPGFQPGGDEKYAYSITVGSNCFVATATGISGTRVDGDTFTIDCNNNRNF